MSNILFAFATLFTLSMCSPKTGSDNYTQELKTETQKKDVDLSGKASAVFASGCFWCVEAVFESVEGVSEAVSGYAGGKSSTANYEMVSSGRTQHAEAVEVFYDPEVVSYETLLEVFFGSQDPTTLNQQGPDRGTQYRSTIFYKSESERKAAIKYMAKLIRDKVFDGPITTTLEPLEAFFDAEDYHQDYEARNPNQPYVKGVSVPRLNKFKAKFPHLLSENKSTH